MHYSRCVMCVYICAQYTNQLNILDMYIFLCILKCLESTHQEDLFLEDLFGLSKFKIAKCITIKIRNYHAFLVALQYVFFICLCLFCLQMNVCFFSVFLHPVLPRFHSYMMTSGWLLCFVFVIAVRLMLSGVVCLLCGTFFFRHNVNVVFTVRVLFVCTTKDCYRSMQTKH